MPGGLQSTALVEMLASSWKVAQWTRKERADAGGRSCSLEALRERVRTL